MIVSRTSEREGVSVRRVVLLGGLAGILLVTGTAFAHTFGSTMAFQQRDEVAVSLSDVTLAGSELEVSYTIENPLDRPVRLGDVEMVVYEGGPPFTDGSELSVRRQAQLVGDDVTIGAGESVTVTVTAPIASSPDRVQAALDDDEAVPSGIMHFTLGDRQFTVEVVPRG